VLVLCDIIQECNPGIKGDLSVQLAISHLELTSKILQKLILTESGNPRFNCSN